MKKQFFSVLTICLLSATSVFGQNSLVSKIMPVRSQGYAHWDNYSDAASYLIQYYELDENGVYNEIGRKRTENNYVQLNIPYFTQSNVYYTISALNSQGSVIDTGDIQPMAGDQSSSVLCSKKCNGNTYAWQLDLNVGSPNPTHTLSLSPTVEFSEVTANSINVVPYYQAIGQTQWDATPNGHPYKSPTVTGGGEYEKVPITPALVASAGPFYNSQSNIVTDGMLVEKKMDQFEYMQTESTSSSAYASPNLCNATLTSGGGWIDFYNQHTTLTPPNFGFANLPVATQLACTNSGAQGGGGQPIDNWHDWYLELHALVDGIESSGAGSGSIGHSELVSLMNLNYFTLVDIAPISGDSGGRGTAIIQKNNSGTATVISSTNTFSKGLYKMVVGTTTGKVLTVVFELSSDVNLSADNEFATLKIAPNPMDGSTLNVMVNSSIDAVAEMFVHDLNGTVILSENISLLRNLDFEDSYDLGDDLPPYNQYIVTLIFEDNSTLQKTVLRTN
jgi:hypothetical protein